MKESIIKLTTGLSGKQQCIKIDYIKLKDSTDEYLDLSSSPFEMEYFDENEVHLPDGDYPYSMFEQVIPAAHVIRPEDSLPLITYRGMKLKKEFIKYREK